MRVKIGDWVELDQLSMDGKKLMRKKLQIVQQKATIEAIGLNTSYGVNDTRRTKTKFYTKPVDIKKGELGNESPLARAIMSHDINIGATFSNGKYRYKLVNVQQHFQKTPPVSKSQLSWEEKRVKFELQKEKPFFKEWFNEQLRCQHGLCAWCQRRLSLEDCEVDHIVPLFRNGTNSYDNLLISCHICNEKKGDTSGYKKPSWIIPNKVLEWTKNKKPL